MKYKGYELSAITSLAIFASAIDGECDENEIAVIFGHLACYVVPENDRHKIIELAANIPFEEAAIIVSKMDYQQKRHFAAFIGSIILADGKITDLELNYWRKLSLATGLPTMTIKEAANIFTSNIVGRTQPTSQSSDKSIFRRWIGFIILVVIIYLIVEYN